MKVLRLTAKWTMGLAGLACLAGQVGAAGGVVVIGHPSVGGVDTATLQKIYTGRVVEVNGLFVAAVNASTGSEIRNRFLQTYLNQDEARYTAYWVVRRYVGQGAPPRELSSSADVIRFVNSTPGAIGYVSDADVKPGMNILLR